MHRDWFSLNEDHNSFTDQFGSTSTWTDKRPLSLSTTGWS